MMFFHNNTARKGRSSCREHAVRDGFSLPEVLIATLVLVLVVFSSTSLLVGVMRSNNENIRTLQAYGLAQEGLEAVRNIRDSNWLLGGRYDGTVGNSRVEVWGAALPSAGFSAVSFYTVDLDVLQANVGAPTDALSLRNAVPWKLVGLEPEQVEGRQDVTRLQTFTSDRDEEVRYSHEFPLGPLGEPSLFYRFVAVENISENPDELSKYRVSSVVRWAEGGREKEVRLDTVLADWNQGQL